MTGTDVVVAVGGDLARSTRMLQHAKSLAARGARVHLVGYSEGDRLAIDGCIVHVVRSFDTLRARGPFFYPAAALRQLALAIEWARVLRRTPASLILVQNPPAFPLLAVLALLRRRVPIVIDWHSDTESMLRLRAGRSPLVRAIGWIERKLARRAAAHLAVSDALRAAHARHGLDATLLYDAPMQRTTSAPRRGDEVVVAVPSSWTDDDDFVLLEKVARRWRGPALRFLLTGRGPRRDTQAARFAAIDNPRVRFDTRWLATHEFTQALATADLGLSLHRSANGHDLPMKIAEMLGCGLPVCVLDYGPVLRERHHEGRGVRFFADASALVTLLEELLEGWPLPKALDALRVTAHDAVPKTWDEEWSATAEPVLRSVLQPRP